MSTLAGLFFRGLLIVVPSALTVYVLYQLFVFMDGLIHLLDDHVPGVAALPTGVGAVVTLVLVTLVGFLATNILTRQLVVLAEHLFTRVPLVKLLYGSIKDLIGAFVGDQKSFDKPVLVSLGDAIGMEVAGFVTRESLDTLGVHDRVAVYFPQSYNFAGNLMLVPRDRVKPLEADSSDVMAFIVSGGVTGKRKR